MERRPQDYWGLREKAEEAESVLGSPIFGIACGELRVSWMDRLVSLPPGDPEVAVIHIKLKVLDEIRGQLQHQINEVQFRKVA